MSLLASTKFFLEEAERVSGRPVVVQEDPTLQTLATVQIARGAAPMHVVKYRPIPNRRPDYHICYQCGFIIRLFENPPENRFSLGPSSEAPERMDAWLAEGPGSPQLQAMKNVLLSGLLTQLRSIPVGLRIDDLIWAQYPELREEQLASAQSQMKQNIQSLTPEIRQTFPRKLHGANTAMNAAFALFWSEKTGDSTLRLPYQSIGAEADGQNLINASALTGASSSDDWNLVDRWAEILGLAGWYKWIRHELE